VFNDDDDDDSGSRGRIQKSHFGDDLMLFQKLRGTKRKDIIIYHLPTATNEDKH
jgi:hypothetical protein